MLDLNHESSVPAAIYARYSTDGQDSRSIEDQRRRCEEFASANGFRIVAQFADQAVSGAHLVRGQMQALLSEVKKGSRCRFRVILVDDLSRLSRDLGTTWKLVFGDLDEAGIAVIDVSSRMASDDPNARIAFGATALVNDIFLQNVRKQTHRGLEGRAIAGFHTGGRVYGYTSVPEEQPEDPVHPRQRLVVEPTESAVVRRIFALYADGASLSSIAATLNREGIPAPYDGGKRVKTAGRGWGINTLHWMLRNERYAGRVVWNKRTWYRPQNSKSRRYRVRPRKDWRVREAPELVIVAPDVWAVVQARIADSRKNRPGQRVRKYVYLLVGLLRCGQCGGRMAVVSRRKKGKHSWANFGCAANHRKGPEICGNGSKVSELKVNEVVFGAIRDLVSRPGFADRFKRAFEGRLSQTGTSDREAAEAAVRELERRVANVTDSLARFGFSESLASRLKDEEARLADARVRLAGLCVKLGPEDMPDPAQLKAVLDDLPALADRAPDEARAALSRLVSDITLTPKRDENGPYYEAVGALNTTTAAIAGGRVLELDGCGGKI